MSMYPEDYQEYVLDDIEKNKGRRRIVKASILERALVRKISPKHIHANPEDEFSQAAIGPNFSIIDDYIRQAEYLDRRGETIYEEPIIVEKIKPGRYMLLNGHHRWFAARRYGVKSLNAEVTNLTHLEHIRKALDKSKLTRRAVFDLDEVLMAGSAGSSKEKIPSHLLSRFIKERLRTGTIKLMKTLEEMGFDIWVYTRSYKSKEYIHAIFRMYGLSIRGCINAFGRIESPGEKRSRTKELFASKYKISVNIDNESVLVVDDLQHDFDQIDLTNTDADWWADGVIRILEKKFLD